MKIPLELIWIFFIVLDLPAKHLVKWSRVNNMIGRWHHYQCQSHLTGLLWLRSSMIHYIVIEIHMIWTRHIYNQLLVIKSSGHVYPIFIPLPTINKDPYVNGKHLAWNTCKHETPTNIKHLSNRFTQNKL